MLTEAEKQRLKDKYDVTVNLTDTQTQMSLHESVSMLTEADKQRLKEKFDVTVNPQESQHQPSILQDSQTFLQEEAEVDEDTTEKKNTNLILKKLGKLEEQITKISGKIKKKKKFNIT